MDTATRQLLDIVHKEPKNVAARLAQALDVSRQAASARLLKAVKAGLIERQGRGAGVRYSVKTQTEVQQSYTRAGLSEDRVWQQLLAPVVADCPENVRDVWRYGLTEMINNAVDHSGSERVHVGMRRNPLFTQAWVTDDGEGIFLRIKRALDLFVNRTGFRGGLLA